MEITWIDDFTITVRVEGDTVTVAANEQGLRSLANHLIALAEQEAPRGHLHLDEYNSLEEGSAELIIERIP